MASADSDYFRSLPPLTSDEVAELNEGQALSLVLLEYVGEGGGVLFPVQYIHRELTYLLPGQRNAIALGRARLDESDDFRDVRILFSRPNGTATLRGLVLEGQVKEGTVRT